MKRSENATFETTALSRGDLWILACLALAVWALYAQVASFDFVAFDDEVYVYGNRKVRSGWSLQALRWAMTAFHAANWHPVTWISHMFDVEWFGLDAGRHHIHNVWLHMMNTVLLFFLFRTTTGHRWPSAFVAAVFAVHPLHVETVAWVSQRKALLSAFFSLNATLGYIRYTRTGGRLPYAAAILLYSLALMSKPTAVTLPLLWLLLDRWPLERIPEPAPPKRRMHLPVPIVEKLPFFAMAGIAGMLTLVAQHLGRAVADLMSLPLDLRMANAAVAGVAYVGKALWPSGLAVFYPFPNDIPPLHWVPAIVLIGIACTVSVAAWRNRPWVFTGWWWYVVSLAPVIGIVQVGAQSMADRYSYLPLVGLTAALAWEVRSRLPDAPRVRRATVLVSVAAGVALAAVSWRQIGYWKDSVHLFRRAVAVTENNATAHTALGLAYLQQGRQDRAETHLRTALVLDPAAAKAHHNLGTLLLQQGRLEAAAGHFAEAVRLRPDLARAYYNLALVRLRQGRPDASFRLLEQSLLHDDEMVEAHFLAGTLLAERGDPAGAADHFRRAASLDADHWESRNNLGTALMVMGREAESVATLQEALRLHPDNAELHNNLGVALARSGRPAEAAFHFKRAVSLRPDFVEARKNLDRMEEGSGK